MRVTKAIVDESVEQLPPFSFVRSFVRSVSLYMNDKQLPRTTDASHWSGWPGSQGRRVLAGREKKNKNKKKSSRSSGYLPRRNPQGGKEKETKMAAAAAAAVAGF